MRKMIVAAVAVLLTCGYALAGCGSATGSIDGDIYPVIEFENDTYKYVFG